MKNKHIYKYLSKQAFIKVIKSGILFSEPRCWSDGYERRFYLADYGKITQDFPVKLYASCFTLVKDNEAAWKAYLIGRDQKSERIVPEEQLCFRLKINRKRFRKMLCEHRLYDFYEVPVQYLPEYDIKNLHLSNVPKVKRLHDSIFCKSKFALDDFLSLLSLKRECFAYEKEVRYFAVPKSNSESEEVTKSFNSLRGFVSMIEEIVVARPYGDFELDDVDLRDLQDELETLCGGKLPRIVSNNIYDDYDDPEVEIIL